MLFMCFDFSSLFIVFTVDQWLPLVTAKCLHPLWVFSCYRCAGFAGTESELMKTDYAQLAGR